MQHCTSPRTSLTTLFFLISLVGVSQVSMRTITGKVSSERRPLPGTSIVIYGTRIGTQSDIKGKFTLQIPVQDTVILCASNLSQPEYYYVLPKTDKLKIRLGRNRKKSDLIEKELLRKWEPENQLKSDSIKNK